MQPNKAISLILQLSETYGKKLSCVDFDYFAVWSNFKLGDMGVSLGGLRTI